MVKFFKLGRAKPVVFAAGGGSHFFSKVASYLGRLFY